MSFFNKFGQFRQAVGRVFQQAQSRRRLETALYESGKGFQALMEKAPLPIQIYRPDGLLVKVNQAYLDMWRIRPVDVIGKFNALRDPQALANGSGESFARVRNGETVRWPEFDYDPVQSGIRGRKRRTRLLFYPMKLGGSAGQHVVLMNEDVTDLRQTTTELRRYKNERAEMVAESEKELARANRRFQREVTCLLRENRQKEARIQKLQNTLFDIEALSGMLPICSSCKSIRNGQGEWATIESFLKAHAGVDLTHSICEECEKILYPGLFDTNSQT